jgi:hypothetical protein
LVAAHDKAGYPTYFEAAMQMPVEKILPLWQDYLNDVAAQRTKIIWLPPSQILGNEALFQNFIQSNYISLEQPKATN